VVVKTPRETWTDERLDEFKASVNQRFDQADKRFDQVERQIAEVKGEVKELRQAMIQGFFVLVGIQVTSTLTIAGLIIF
jgi:tetrahydromethanopterin S-methyltransferase subunit G